MLSSSIEAVSFGELGTFRINRAGFRGRNLSPSSVDSPACDLLYCHSRTELFFTGAELIESTGLGVML